MQITEITHKLDDIELNQVPLINSIGLYNGKLFNLVEAYSRQPQGLRSRAGLAVR